MVPNSLGSNSTSHLSKTTSVFLEPPFVTGHKLPCSSLSARVCPWGRLPKSKYVSTIIGGTAVKSIVDRQSGNSSRKSSELKVCKLNHLLSFPFPCSSKLLAWRIIWDVFKKKLTVTWVSFCFGFSMIDRNTPQHKNHHQREISILSFLWLCKISC